MTDLITYSPPGALELEATMELAVRLSNTNFVPAAYRGKPDETLACMLTGRELGIGQMQALRDIYLEHGRPSMMATLMAQLARRAGHKVRVLKQTATECTVQIHRADQARPEEPLTWTLEDARTAGLLSKDNWKRYPKAMLWNRAVAAAVRRDCSEVLGGVLYTPEELGSSNTEATWGDAELNAEQVAISESTLGAYVQDSDRLGGEPRPPAQPVGASMPTHDQVEKLRDPGAARELVVGAGDEFQRRIRARFPTDAAWRGFWRQAPLVAWRDHLHDAITEMSGAAVPPKVHAAPDPQSDPGRADHRTREAGRQQESAMTPGSDPNLLDEGDPDG